MKRLSFTDAAREDLAAIGRYTLESWGAEKKTRYLAGIRASLERLRRATGIGRVRDEIRPGYRSVASGRHVIFYRETEDRIEVVRVLHQRMDLHRHLNDPAG
jgi:toxin ParE1/3/4